MTSSACSASSACPARPARLIRNTGKTLVIEVVPVPGLRLTWVSNFNGEHKKLIEIAGSFKRVHTALARPPPASPPHYLEAPSIEYGEMSWLRVGDTVTISNYSMMNAEDVPTDEYGVDVDISQMRNILQACAEIILTEAARIEPPVVVHPAACPAENKSTWTVEWVEDSPHGPEDALHRPLLFAEHGGREFSFLVGEPYLIRLSQWRALADGANTCVNLYMGNGEGSIKGRDGYLIFIAAPSGSGGDVTFTARIPLIELDGLLHTALDEAVRRGLEFDKEE